MFKRFKRIIIFGAGNVGSTIAAFLINENLTREILFFERKKHFLKAQILDLQDHALNQHHSIHVAAATWKDCNEADVIIIAAGKKQRFNQLRDDLATANAKVVKQFIQKLNSTAFHGFIIVVTNPVDQMTYLVHRFSKLPAPHIIGTGTSLDVLRMRGVLRRHLGRTTKQKINLIGEHGVKLLLPKLMNSRFYQYLNRFQFRFEDLIMRICAVPFEIIRGKRATYYGIANVVLEIIKQLKKKTPSQMNLSVLFNDLVISHPCTISKMGILPLTPFLKDNERAQFHHLLEAMAEKQIKLWKSLFLPANKSLIRIKKPLRE